MNTRETMKPEEFAGLGGGVIAYVKPMTSDALKAAFPNAPALQPGIDLWALCAADGTPLMVADSREALIQNASENDLQTVSLH
jgi:hypothetical protein